MARHRENTNGWFWVLPSLLIPLAIAAVAWTTHVASEGEEVAPNVRFAGLDMSGLTPAAAADEVGKREREFLSTPITIDLGESSVVLTAGEIGFDYLYDDTVSQVITARHADRPWDEFLAWAETPFETVTIDDHYVLDEIAAAERLTAEDFIIRTPVEPELTNDDASYMYAIPGTPGVGVDVEQVISALEAAPMTAGPVEIQADPMDIPPTISDESAREVALQINDMTRPGLLAVVGDTTASLSPGRMRSHLVSSVEDGVMSVEMDMAAFQKEVEAAFPEPIGEFVAPELEVVDGVVVVSKPGRPAPVCCSEESVQAAAQSYLDGGQTFYLLDTRPDNDERIVAWANGSQVKEVVSEFTTNHPCCESRVTNIQTMADFMQGKYLIPGETLSMNEYVGPRTADKGYVAAGAIRGGYMTEELGGGVSQFITTLFNAAFFGGLDLDGYQSHSIYFSRYPFGREATLSNPNPDLQITNSTDYPVLIWPTYTDNSITVTLYSTKNVDVEELEQRVTRRNQCTHSEIDRQRTFSDGRVEVDTIVANYRPDDGLDCNGRPIPQS